ncbi:hypothetical protein [Paenibacillus chitinolyticus]|uniref:hypothetical protein n=1 Tax=Paenibacillus chitinolyticus TaxID=79263 RepID=UPI001C447E59|nr:hypothetical protein [Paenibacillus chitinolyticus]MBV6716234.1 hypothetical protein [Paenibacillus chitinolyticus]
MNNIIKKVSTSLLAIGLSLTMLTTGALASENQKLNSITSQDEVNPLVGVDYSNLKKGHSKLLGGSSFSIVYGSNYVSVSPTGWTTGLAVGDARVDAYDANGNHYWTFYIHVTN